ncbi:ZIP family metal transporter [Candidatus Woesearchaeota archaeon]|nr:ZIP family metal transporter [Candidatus Woesearchaeota archaeon]
MNLIILYTILSVLAVSLVSFVGIFSLFLQRKNPKKVLLILVSLSAGTLFGGAFLHLLPEVVEKNGFTLQVSLFLLLGVVVFFILEKLIHWHHCHHHGISEPHCHSESNSSKKKHEHQVSHHSSKAIAPLNLIGDAMHNFLDGLVIAGSYLVDVRVGVAATIAVILHEVPQEIADFGVLIYAGLSRAKALMLNFASAAVAILGAIVGLFFSSASETFSSFILPFAAGGFVYIAGSNLIPELHKHGEMEESIWHFIALVAGIGLMVAITYLE